MKTSIFGDIMALITCIVIFCNVNDFIKSALCFITAICYFISYYQKEAPPERGLLVKTTKDKYYNVLGYLWALNSLIWAL